MIRSVLKGTGSYLPEKVLTNDDLEKMVQTSSDWIVQRTGIEQRHIAAEGETTSDMAINAARQALEAASFSASDIDGIVVATTTPDLTFPSVATKVQAALGIAPCLAMDVQAVCSGFIYALSVADNFIKNGQAKNILVIGADKMSSIVNWEDRTTCVLFADGAGAVILSAEASEQETGILSTHLYADGTKREMLCTSDGPSTNGEAGHIVMQGRDVFKHAVNYMAEIVDEVLDKNGIGAGDIDWLVPHQANIRIIQATAEKLDMPMAQVVVTVNKHGNTSAASIPLALDTAFKDGRIKPGETVLLEAMGGGFTWGAALLKV